MNRKSSFRKFSFVNSRDVVRMMRRQGKNYGEEWILHPVHFSYCTLQKRFIIDTPASVIVFVVIIFGAAEIIFKPGEPGKIIKAHRSVCPAMKESSLVAF